MSDTKLLKLMAKCKCSVCVDVNRHRDYYQTAEESLEELSRNSCPPEIDEETRKIMIKTNTIIEVHFYPRTPVSFYSIYGYDLNKLLDEALNIMSPKETPNENSHTTKN